MHNFYHKNIMKKILVIAAASAVLFSCTEKPEEDISVIESSIELDPSSVVIPASGGSRTITVTSAEGWEVSDYKEGGWCELSSISGKDSDEVIVSVSTPTYEPREVTFTFVSGTAKTTLTVSQDLSERSISISPASLEFTSAGGRQEVTVECAGGDWKADESLSWLSVEKADNGKAVVIVEQNESVESLSGKVIFRNADKEAELSVSQEAASAIVFADAKFKEIVLATEGADRNGDGFITEAEATAVTVIDTRRIGEDIITIEDIKYFPALREFFITDNSNIVTADFTRNRELETLVCQNNPNLVSADVSGLDRLQLFDIQGCGKISTLSVKGCSSLREFAANNLVSLSELDVTDCVELRNFYFQNNENLRRLDLTKCTKLELLQMNYAPLFEGDLDLSRNVAIREINICDFFNSNVILGVMPNLQNATLNYNNDKVTSFDFSGSPELVRLECLRNRALASVKLEGCTHLQAFLCFDTAISELDLSTNNELTDFQPGSPDATPRYIPLKKLTLSREHSIPESRIEDITTYCEGVEIVYVD